MDKKTKVLFLILLLLTFISVAASFYRFIVLHDYAYYYDDYGEGEETAEGEEQEEIIPEI
jgi:hypothetical protein